MLELVLMLTHAKSLSQRILSHARSLTHSTRAPGRTRPALPLPLALLSVTVACEECRGKRVEGGPALHAWPCTHGPLALHCTAPPTTVSKLTASHAASGRTFGTFDELLDDHYRLVQSIFQRLCIHTQHTTALSTDSPPSRKRIEDEDTNRCRQRKLRQHQTSSTDHPTHQAPAHSQPKTTC